MKKYDENQKITALGVVIFSFVSVLIGAIVLLLVDSITALLVLKTALPEKALQFGNIAGSGVGIIVAAAILTAKGKMKGIVSSAIIAGATIVIKLAGNHLMNLDGYFSLNGLIGILFILIFSIIGGVIGSNFKR